MPKLLAVVGPTGSGKTKLAIKLAQKFNGIIISADSRQVYRGLDIGTNKEGAPGRCTLDPTWGKDSQSCRVIDGVSQLLIDVADPGDRFTLNDWLTQARYALKHIFGAGQLPIVVGGTGLYITALLEGYQPGGGRFARNNTPVDFQSLILMPDVDRAILNQKSDERFPKIFDTLLSETEALLAAGVPAQWLNRIGLDYRYILYYIRRDTLHKELASDYIRKQLSREEAIGQYQAASRAYIRRQITWWRHHGKPEMVSSIKQAESLAKHFLE